MKLLKVIFAVSITLASSANFGYADKTAVTAKADIALLSLKEHNCAERYIEQYQWERIYGHADPKFEQASIRCNESVLSTLEATKDKLKSAYNRSPARLKDIRSWYQVHHAALDEMFTVRDKRVDALQERIDQANRALEADLDF